VRVLNIRWLGVPTDDLAATRAFFESVLGLRVRFEEPGTVELVTAEDDRVQLFAGRPGAPVPLFEVDDVDAARLELEAAGIELVGDVERDSEWAYFAFRGPDGNVYELASRL